MLPESHTGAEVRHKSGMAVSPTGWAQVLHRATPKIGRRARTERLELSWGTLQAAGCGASSPWELVDHLALLNPSTHSGFPLIPIALLTKRAQLVMYRCLAI